MEACRPTTTLLFVDSSFSQDHDEACRRYGRGQERRKRHLLQQQLLKLFGFWAERVRCSATPQGPDKETGLLASRVAQAPEDAPRASGKDRKIWPPAVTVQAA
ncbi:hypothetical protein MRX96_048837 [Rhipicephalus microplus]